MAKVDTVKAEYDIKKDTLTGHLDFSVNKSLKFKARCTPQQVLRAELVGKAWSLAFDVPKQTLIGSVKGKFEGGEVKLTQVVPKMDWSAVPSPEVEVTTKIIQQPDVKDKLKLKYDLRTHKASLVEKVYIQRIYKLEVAADTSTHWDGATYLGRSKFERPYCHSLGVRYSKDGGPVLKYKAKPTPTLKVKTETAPKPETFAASMVYKPELRENAEVGLAFKAPMRGAKTKGNMRAASVHLKWKF